VGLAVPLAELDTRVSQGRWIRLPDAGLATPDAREWCLHGFDVGAGYVASVAVEGRDVRAPSPARCIDELIAMPVR
jgi:hypothetical protein